jgi:hypothetical protein
MLPYAGLRRSTRLLRNVGDPTHEKPSVIMFEFSQVSRFASHRARVTRPSACNARRREQARPSGGALDDSSAAQRCWADLQASRPAPR